MIHNCWVEVGLSPAVIWGSAMFKIVMSISLKTVYRGVLGSVQSEHATSKKAQCARVR